MLAGNSMFRFLAKLVFAIVYNVWSCFGGSLGHRNKTNNKATRTLGRTSTSVVNCSNKCSVRAICWFLGDFLLVASGDLLFSVRLHFSFFSGRVRRQGRAMVPKILQDCTASLFTPRRPIACGESEGFDHAPDSLAADLLVSGFFFVGLVFVCIDSLASAC